MMKRAAALILTLAFCLCLIPAACASGEATEEEMTAEEQEWWDSFEIPEGMEDVQLYPDDQLALREKNYETVCRYMQGLSPYLYLLYADDVVTGVAYDFSLTSESVRTSNIEFQKMLDASNAEMYPDWEWTNIKVYQSEDPNVFMIECDGGGSVVEDGVVTGEHHDHYLHRFTLSDGKITEYIEYNNPIQELIEAGYDIPMPSGGGGGMMSSNEASADETEVADGLTADEQAWWDSFEIPEGMEDVALYPDDQLELREKNYETVCRYMQGLSEYLYLLYADEFSTGVAYDFGGTTDPFDPVMCTDLTMQKSLDASNASSYPDWEWTDLVVYQSDDPNIFLVECDGGGSVVEDGVVTGEHHDHYVHEFILEDGLIVQYIEFNSPINELIEGGYEVPDIR